MHAAECWMPWHMCYIQLLAACTVTSHFESDDTIMLPGALRLRALMLCWHRPRCLLEAGRTGV